MKRVALIGFVFATCLIFVCGCADSASKEAETSTETQNTETQNTETQNVETQKSKTEFVEEFEKQFEKAAENDAVFSFSSGIYPYYVYRVFNNDDGVPIVEVGNPSTDVEYILVFEEDAKVFLDGEPVELSDIKEGDYLSVYGRLSKDKTAPRHVTDIEFAILYR